MVPPFELQGGVAPALARACADTGLLGLFGSLVFRASVLPRVVLAMTPEEAEPVLRRQSATARAGAAVAAVGLLLWLIVQASAIAGATSGSQWAASLPIVALHTRFGRLILAQLAAVSAASAVLALPQTDRTRVLALAGATIGLALQAGHSHAAAMGRGIGPTLVADLLHLAGAGAWLGGLLPLLWVVHDAPARAGALAARWFSPLGKACIGALVVSAIVQGRVLVASWVGFVGTAYGWVVLLKLTLLAALLAFAAVNRTRLAPALLRAEPDGAKAALVRSIAIQSGVGLATVAAAALLANLPPAMHVQPVWPFAWRFSLAAVQDDPAYRGEALGAAIALAGALALALAAFALSGPRRAFAGAACVLIAGAATTHLSPLFVPAYPTSFYRSPTGFSVTAIGQGALLYPIHCAACHGAQGRGDGPAGTALPLPPADLTAAHLWMHSDGELFWWLSSGIVAPDGAPAMPGFGGALTDDQRWALIDFMRARNAGLAFAISTSGRRPSRAPNFRAHCAGAREVTLGDLQGGFVRLVMSPKTGPAEVTAERGAVTILLDAGPATTVAPGLCRADDGWASQAYAIAAGLPLERLAGAQFLIDAGGWLRAVQTGPGAGWNDPRALAAAIAAIAAQPPVSAPMPSNMKM